MTWLEAAQKFTTAAEKAREEGDIVSSLYLAIEASKCVQIARNLEGADRYLKNPRIGEQGK